MRISVHHTTAYHYQVPPRYMIQTLRMTPRAHDNLAIRKWRITVDQDVRLHESEDSFGNIVHTFSANRPFESLTISVEGSVNSDDAAGVVSGTRERFPPSLYLRQTDLTRPNRDIIAYARSMAGDGPVLDRLHALMAALLDYMTFDTDPTDVGTNAGEAFNSRKGVCQDYSHIMLAACRALGIPARYVSGYFHRIDDQPQQEAGHAWIEAYTGPEIGWVGFDPANGICVTDQHVRVATGLDYQDAAPIRGTRHGGSAEELDVSLHVDQGRMTLAQ